MTIDCSQRWRAETGCDPCCFVSLMFVDRRGFRAYVVHSVFLLPNKEITGTASTSCKKAAAGQTIVSVQEE